VKFNDNLPSGVTNIALNIGVTSSATAMTATVVLFRDHAMTEKVVEEGPTAAATIPAAAAPTSAVGGVAINSFLGETMAAAGFEVSVSALIVDADNTSTNVWNLVINFPLDALTAADGTIPCLETCTNVVWSSTTSLVTATAAIPVGTTTGANNVKFTNAAPITLNCKDGFMIVEV
jgi:hypothetical protein